jgi:hypothetical protein
MRPEALDVDADDAGIHDRNLVNARGRDRARAAGVVADRSEQRLGLSSPWPAASR